VRRVLVIGIGAGDPSQITVEAIEALNSAVVLFEIERGATDLTLARQEICRRYLRQGRAPRIVTVAEPVRDRCAPAYGAAVEEWRTERARVWEVAIGELADDACGGFLVWGDPSLYDSTIAALDEIVQRGTVAFTYDVIPGVSSMHALTARHRISLNRVGGSVLVTTGRRLAERGLPDGVDDVDVMLDGGCSFRHVIDEPLDIYWGAYLGTQDEILVSGPLSTVAGEIERVRGEARERKGWIMDCYLLRRT
jgi:precorrin-6A synthase